MFENRKVMKKIYISGFPTPYSVKDMIKTLIELNDPEAICLYLKANPYIDLEYVKILIEALINSTNDIKWYEYISKINSKFPFETQKEIKFLMSKIENFLDMHSAYHHGIDF